jgi:predicted transcriptional regulator
MADNTDSNELMALTTEIVCSHVANNTVGVSDLPQLIQQVYATLANIGKAQSSAIERPQPAVPVKRSITPDYIVCLEDGRKRGSQLCQAA